MKTTAKKSAATRSPTRKPRRKAKLTRTRGTGPLTRKRELIADQVGATGTRELNRSATSSIP